VRFCVRIAIRFGIQFLAKSLSQLNFSSILAKICRQTIVMVSDEELDPYLACMQIVDGIIREIVHGFVHV
jgi:hypothetical protein